MTQSPAPQDDAATTTADSAPAAKARPRPTRDRSRKSGFIESMSTKTALRNYRIAAWVVGVPLALLFLVAMPMKYLADNGTPVTIIGIAHGWLYMLYIVATAMLSMKRRWTLKRTVLVVLAGTIPLVSFWTEHVVHKKVTAGEPGW